MGGLMGGNDPSKTALFVQSCLDHIYVRASDASIDSAVIKHKISDHYLTAVAVQWKRTGWTIFREPSARASSHMSHDDIITLECPIELYNALSQRFVSIYTECYKNRKVVHSNRNKIWINSNLKEMLKNVKEIDCSTYGVRNQRIC
ncbi:unnamed protein product [Arctia plantaginis]|uniref:Uncharacterized protein n=1 Tax=Arctia plantaginis TaxID=874455 RepID=A0A8S1B3I8_ARCPL|nr:unnamed protein product [Arctia plantaginis]